MKEIVWTCDSVPCMEEHRQVLFRGSAIADLPEGWEIVYDNELDFHFCCQECLHSWQQVIYQAGAVQARRIV